MRLLAVVFLVACSKQGCVEREDVQKALGDGAACNREHGVRWSCIKIDVAYVCIAPNSEEIRCVTAADYWGKR